MGSVRVRSLSKQLVFRSSSAHSLSEFFHLLTQGRSPGESFWALRNLDFDVAPGELLGVVGPNGSGKTTLLKIISRIFEATEGEVDVKGRVVPLLQIGAGFHMDLTGRDNVFANAALLGVNRARVEKLFDEILDFSGIETYIEVPVKYYSSGMFVRLAFAIAVHCDPEVILTDEILAVGDISFQAKCLDRFHRLCGGGACGIFVSHIPAMVLQFCQNAFFIQKGVIQSQGLARDVVDRYIASSMNRPEETDGPVRIESVALSSPAGPERVQWGLPATCEIRIRCLADVPCGAVDVGFFSMLHGAPISWSTSQTQFADLHLSKGTHVLRWVIDRLFVWPGTYYLQIRVRQGSNEIIPWSARRPMVVMPSEKENSELLLHAEAGAFYPRHHWEMTSKGVTT